MRRRTRRGETAIVAAGSALVFSLAFAHPARAQVVLYDGALNTAPSDQGWAYQAFPGPAGETATVSVGGGVTTLTTTGANGIQAGYSRIAPFSLDRATGFTLDFDVKLLSEAHASNDRAGFSVIVLSHDKKGIELGFWDGLVWAQSDSPFFTHAEEAFGSGSRLVVMVACLASWSSTSSSSPARLRTAPART